MTNLTTEQLKNQIIKDIVIQSLRDWETIRILDDILNNDNDNIVFTKLGKWATDKQEDEPIHVQFDTDEFTRRVCQLKELFQDGYEYFYKTEHSHGDEGGTCMTFYLATEEDLKPHWEYFDTFMLGTGVDDLLKQQLFHMKIISENPEIFTLVQAHAF